MVGGVWAGSDSPLEGWGAVSEGAGHELGVGADRVPAPGENLEVVQGERGSASREDVRRTMLVSEGRLWGEGLAFNAGICVGAGIAVVVGVIFGVGAV